MRAISLGVCVGVSVHAYMCVWVHAQKPVNTCLCVCVRIIAIAHAGDSMSAGCLCFSVCQFHFVLSD